MGDSQAHTEQAQADTEGAAVGATDRAGVADGAGVGAAAAPALRSVEAAQRLVLEIVGEHADSLLGVARRHSLCLDDAQDAYQRAIEILIRHSRRLEEDGAPRWTHTVVKHEAMRLRASRTRMVASEEVDLDAHEASRLPDAEERVAAFDRMTRTAEAMQRLKPQEVRALWLRAQGLSYEEIARVSGWTYTKVNRCVTEGRRSLLTRYAEIERGVECERWAPVLSALVDGEAAAGDLAKVRPHLRNCPACRATVRALHESNRAVAALLPLPVAAASGDRVDAAGGLLARAWELLTGPLHERAAMSATKLQTAIEATATGKAAAIAASAAAIAGGGVAVDRAVVSRPAAEAEARTARVAEQGRRAVPAAAPTTLSATQVARRSRGGDRPAAAVTVRARRHERIVSRELGVSGPTTASASAASASTATSSREFEPRATSAGAGSSAPAAPAGRSPAAEQAATEFGGG